MLAGVRAVGSVLEDLLLYGRSCRVVLIVLLALIAGLCLTPQAQDALITLGQSTSVQVWAGIVASTAWLGLNAWFWSRFILGIRLFHGAHRRGAATRARRRQCAHIRALLPRVLGLAPFLGVSAALLGAAGRIPEEMHAQMSAMESGTERLHLAAAAIALLGAGFFLVLTRRRLWMQAWRGRLLARCANETAVSSRFLRTTRFQRETAPAFGKMTGTAKLLLGLSSLAALAGMVLYGTAPVQTARVLQPGPTILCAAAGLMSGGTILVFLGARWRAPILLIVVVGAFILAVLRDADVIPDNHDVRLAPGQLPRRPSLEEAFAQFLAASEARYPAPIPVPVVLVAASGGGLAAAFWTATVLGELADASPGFAEQLFGISGVSGGSLGALEFVAALGAAGHCRSGGLRGCTQLALSEDFLGPAVGALLYPDLMQRFLPVPVFADRAVAIERAWEAQWRRVFHDDRLSQPFLRLWRPQHPWPALFLNGTSLFTGGRVVTSNLSLRSSPAASGGGSILSADAVDLLQLAQADVPASTAANNSARFPYIGPFGAVRDRGTGAPRTIDAVADGGYFENFGAATLLDVLDGLNAAAGRRGRAVRFIVLQIIGSADFRGQGRRFLLPRGLTGPVETLLRSRNARGLNATENLARRALELGGAHIPVRLGLSPTGGTAPLGWSLSAVARRVIDEQWTTGCRNRLLADMALPSGDGGDAESRPGGFMGRLEASACLPVGRGGMAGGEAP